MTLQLPLSSFILNPIDMGQLWKWLATGWCSHLIPIHESRHFLSLWFVFPFCFVFFLLRVSQKPQLPRCTVRRLWRRSGGRDNDNIWSDIIYSVNTLPLLVSIQSRHKVIYLRRQRRTNSCLYSTILMAPWGGKHGCLFLFQWSSSCGWVGWMECCQHNRNRLC